MTPRKRSIPKHKQLRNVGYLALIGIVFLAACLIGQWAWAVFLATAYYFWPQGHYGERGVK